MPSKQAAKIADDFLASLGIKQPAPKRRRSSPSKAAVNKGKQKRDELQAVVDTWKSSQTDWTESDVLLTSPARRSNLLKKVAAEKAIDTFENPRTGEQDINMLKSYKFKTLDSHEGPYYSGTWYFVYNKIQFRIFFGIIDKEITSVEATMQFRHRSTKDENREIFTPMVERFFGEFARKFVDA